MMKKPLPDFGGKLTELESVGYGKDGWGGRVTGTSSISGA
jgi:hypothetical protein